MFFLLLGSVFSASDLNIYKDDCTKMEDIMKDKGKLEYIMGLISTAKQRRPNTTLNFDTLLEMVTAKERGQKDANENITETLYEYNDVEESIISIYDEILEAGSNNFPELQTKKHLSYLQYFLNNDLPSGFVVLEASHPWILYWLLNAIALLGVEILPETKLNVGKTILTYIDEETGGFGGGVGQIAHCADSYASLLALAIIQDEESLSKLDTNKIYKWLLSLKQPNGSFLMHIGGEEDTRAVYCALCIASLLDIMTDELVKGTAEWLASCQTYEGGFGGVPFDEAHGGYTFCGLAALCILLTPQEIRDLPGLDLEKLIEWTVKRQDEIQGGLSGRSNKLVDGCYSHWVGGLSPLLEVISGEKLFINRIGLQNYILGCCQGESGGLRDKPGTHPDFYHTNYVLCGLSMCQSLTNYKEDLAVEGPGFGYVPAKIDDVSIIDNLEANSVQLLDPVYGVPLGSSISMHRFYHKRHI